MVGHVLVKNLKDWIEWSLQLNWILNSKHMGDMTIQIYNQNWYIVETHSILDRNEVENLTDLNVDATQ